VRDAGRARAVAACGLVVAAFVLAAGCGGGGGGGAGGSGGSGAPGGSSGSTNAACSPATRVGGFAVKLVEAPGTPPLTAIDGGIRNGVQPNQIWQQKGGAAGTCRLMVGPTLVCTTPCTNPQICAGQNQCIDPPTLQNLGAVTITGVGPSSLMLTPANAAQNIFAYSTSLQDPYPPFSPGGVVTLRNAGATIPAFSLEASGIEPLVFAGTNLTLRNGEALPFTWTAPAAATAVPVLAEVEIGHHGGVFARIDCEFPDTGSAEIPASLVSALIAEGVHGYPTLTLTRRSVSSTNLAVGCADLSVAAVVQRDLMVCPTPSTCIVSCVSDDMCTAPLTCKPDFTCG
jgi:hypothetical protein